ncbi:30S ribosomal protein S9 [bacterium]|nr:30S ribosomal protein S9 [bacterium]
MAEKASKFIQKTGRRKTATARVRIIAGKGVITVNNMPLKDFFQDIKGAETYIKEPLVLVGYDKKFDISVIVSGGGKKGQLDAVRLGVARALVSHDEALKTTLKKNELLTRDSRMKERKKYGLKRARKAPQYRKR